jgi:hypothetical protein
MVPEQIFSWITFKKHKYSSDPHKITVLLPWLHSIYNIYMWLFGSIKETAFTGHTQMERYLVARHAEKIACHILISSYTSCLSPHGLFP